MIPLREGIGCFVDLLAQLPDLICLGHAGGRVAGSFERMVKPATTQRSFALSNSENLQMRVSPKA